MEPLQGRRLHRCVTPRRVASVFISYRVASGRAHARLLYDRLAAHFTIFFDQESIRGGEDWAERIRGEIESAVAVLAVIDPQWSLSFKESRETNFVEVELKTAIDLRKTVIPLLVGGAHMPSRDEIPTLKEILEEQFIVLHDDVYDASVARLVAALEGRDAVIQAIQHEILALLTQRQYVEAEHIVLRQPQSTQDRAEFLAYLALARLGGRSFNSLHPNERNKIETLVRRARALAPSWELPVILLAILEIDYYGLHGLVSAEPVPASAVRLTRLDEPLRPLLTGMRLSRRAVQELHLDASQGSTS